MTRINVIPVEELTDQHLMAEYRELPMVMSSARRSSVTGYKPTSVYTLNKGHVKFFYNKKQYLLERWMELIVELNDRGFKIDPASRVCKWAELDKFPQMLWIPDQHAMDINRERIQERINAKRSWYRYRGTPLT
jgi:deoxyribonuclease (pyrimidine dimer)